MGTFQPARVSHFLNCRSFKAKIGSRRIRKFNVTRREGEVIHKMHRCGRTDFSGSYLEVVEFKNENLLVFFVNDFIKHFFDCFALNQYFSYFF